jgi:hypothetical protein
LYVRRGRLYIEHLVFAAHFNTFVFVLWSVLFVPWIRKWSGSDWITIGGALVYLFIAMRAVYGQSPLATLLKEVGLGCGCLSTLFIVSAVVMGVLMFLSITPAAG